MSANPTATSATPTPVQTTNVSAASERIVAAPARRGGNPLGRIGFYLLLTLILLYLLLIADAAGIDLAAAARAKLAKNDARYPVDKAHGSRAKYSELG